MRRFSTILAMAYALVAAAPAFAQDPAPARQLTVEEAVQLALENNLGIRVARIDPQVQDLNVAQALAGWRPTLTTSLQQENVDQPATSTFLSGGREVTSDDRFSSNVGIQQATPWGGRYSIGWDALRQTTTNNATSFSPLLRSGLSFHVEQPLIRNFSIDNLRQQVMLSRTGRDISDVQLRQTLATTTRTVRTAYWDLAYAIALLQVQQQSLDLAEESLRNTRSRVEIGTTAPIDIVEAEAEVATRQEAVIVAQAQIATAEDRLRSLILDPAAADFWTVRLVPTELPAFQPANVDVDAIVRNALERRTDLQESRKNLESDDINIRYFRNQALPEVTAVFDYGLTGLGGTRLIRSEVFGGDVIGTSTRGFGSVLGDVFGNQYPTWTLGLNISYPVGRSPQEANLARARLQYSQSTARIRSQELQVATQVRNAVRQVNTNQQRVQTTRASRELAERRLDAEQRKFAAGTTTTFFVFQAQRDLAVARNNELRAILDYNVSIVDLETVQEAPLAP